MKPSDKPKVPAKSKYDLVSAEFCCVVFIPKAAGLSRALRFKIDPAPYEAALNKLKGTLEQEKTQLEKAKRDEARLKPLFAENAVSRKDYEDSVSARETAMARVQSARAAYFDLRNLDLQLDIARGTLASRQEALCLVTKRFEGGVVSELDLRQAESEAAVAAAAVPNLEQQIVQRENELSILLGRNPENITRGRGVFEAPIPEVPVGLPSTLIVRRPDILAAEESLVAANTRIGAARAAYFPRLSLTGLLGVESTELSDWFNRGSCVWQIAGGLTAPIFTAGRLGAEVETATAQQQQALYDYLRTIQTSFREVEDSLIATRKIREQQAEQDRQVQALQRTLRLATLRYENGYSSFLEVLDAQRSLFSAELQQVQLQRARLGAIVDLYKALGGGWTP